MTRLLRAALVVAAFGSAFAMGWTLYARQQAAAAENHAILIDLAESHCAACHRTMGTFDDVLPSAVREDRKKLAAALRVAAEGDMPPAIWHREQLLHHLDALND